MYEKLTYVDYASKKMMISSVHMLLYHVYRGRIYTEAETCTVRWLAYLHLSIYTGMYT